MTLGEREKREIAAAQGRLGVRDDGSQARHAPARSDERGRRRMLPALQFGHAECDDVRIEKRAAALQRGEQATIDFGERGLECFGVGAARERQGLPAHLTQVQLVPSCFQRGGVPCGEETLECRRKSAQPANRIHARNVESAWILRYPIRCLNLARSCAGAGLSSPQSSRLPPAPVEAAAAPLSSASPDPSPSPAESPCGTRRSWRSRRSMPAAGSEAGCWRCASWTTAAAPKSRFASRSSWSRTLRSSPSWAISTRAPHSPRVA